jgi:alcohol dehydrogenase (NADP+)
MWASALGAEVYAISHSPNKKDDALKLGAKHFILSSEKDWAKPYAFTFDFILNCADATDKFNLSDYFSTLKVNCTFHNVGLPDSPFPQLKATDFASNGCSMGTSHLGSRPEMLAMLKLAADKGLHPYIETLPLSESGCKEGVERVHDNKVRYRLTLVDFDKQFPNRQ